MLSRAQYDAIRHAAAEHSSQAECFVVLAWFTGHRSKSIRCLRWSDVDLAGARIHWRGDADKIEYDHWNPLHREAVAVLARERTLAGLTTTTTVVDGWVFPSPRLDGKPLSREALAKLWNQLAVAAKLPKHSGYGWHAFRRAFANALRDEPIRDLKDLGGWKTERTVVEVYMQPNEVTQRRALKALDDDQNGPPEEERAQGTGTRR